MRVIDVVVLARTASQDIYEMNLEAIASLRRSEPDIQFNVWLIESNPSFKELGWEYDDETKVIIPGEDFNFNRFNNIGREQGTADWIVFSNNDVVFKPGWCSAMLRVHEDNPKIRCMCPVDPESLHTPPGTFPEGSRYVIGHWVRVTFTGWCFMVQRSVFSETGPFDECFDYYFADDDFTLQLRLCDILNAAVPGATVLHLAHVTSLKNDLNIGDRFKKAQKIFHDKWGSQRMIALKNRLTEIILRPLGMKTIIRQLYRHD
jgi:GT2 family glycosyltransferase